MQLSAVLLTIGLPAIDESLDKLLVAMETFPNVAVLGDAVGLALRGFLRVLDDDARTARHGRDEAPPHRRHLHLHILLIVDMRRPAGAWQGAGERDQGDGAGQEQGGGRLRAEGGAEADVQDSIATAQQVAAIGQDAAWWDKLIYNVENLGNTINNYAQRAVVATETKVSEWINDVIRFVGELIFQMSYYGILVAQRIFMAIMMIFCPIMFALSLAPPWNSAWSQWMSKFLSLSLWGFVTYMCLYYVDFILLYNLQQDLVAYDHLLHGSVNSWSQIGALGLQGIGSNCMYAMGMLVGAYIIRFVPEVASWLIPGGVSSGAATAAGSTAAGIASMAGGAAGSVAGGAVSMVKPKSGR